MMADSPSSLSWMSPRSHSNNSHNRSNSLPAFAGYLLPFLAGIRPYVFCRTKEAAERLAEQQQQLKETAGKV